jgi:5-methylthioadenosine/S-adenosylhomocysteine deaminase
LTLALPDLVLRNARTWDRGALALHDVLVRDGRVAAVEDAGAAPRAPRDVDLEERVLLPGLVNGHDQLDLSTVPPLGWPPYRSLYDWTGALHGGGFDATVRDGMAVPLVDRLLLGGLRNLLAGVTAVLHHGPYHRALGRPGFPVRVLRKYAFAHSPGLTPHLRKTYRTTDRRIPWIVRAAEGIDAACSAEVDALAAANVLRQNTVILHGTGLRPDDAPRLAAARASVVWCPEADRRLYGDTAPIRRLRAAGVQIGLGSDSPAAGPRDALSNLAAARKEGIFTDDELLDLATSGTAEAARLPVGGFSPDAPADFVAVESLARLLAGGREAVALVVVAGRPVYGLAGLLDGLMATAGLIVDGQPRSIDAELGRRLAAARKRHATLARVAWLVGVDVPGAPRVPPSL